MINLDKLEALAAVATPGPWRPMSETKRNDVSDLVLSTVKETPGLRVPELVSKLSSTGVAERDTRAAVQRLVESGPLTLDRGMKLYAVEKP